jgi:hypothetical protein
LLATTFRRWLWAEMADPDTSKILKSDMPTPQLPFAITDH